MDAYKDLGWTSHWQAAQKTPDEMMAHREKAEAEDMAGIPLEDRCHVSKWESATTWGSVYVCQTCGIRWRVANYRRH